MRKTSRVRPLKASQSEVNLIWAAIHLLAEFSLPAPHFAPFCEATFESIRQVRKINNKAKARKKKNSKRGATKGKAKGVDIPY